MPTMPNVAGIGLYAAQASLQSAGVLNPDTLGYYGIWPINVQWQRSASTPGTVLSQSPAQGTPIAVNSTVTLGVAEFPTGVVYP